MEKKKAKTLCKKSMSFLLALLLLLTAIPLGGLTAFAATSGDFEYNVLSEEDKTCEITKYAGSATALDIPSKIDGYTVTSIGEDAFWNCTSLTSVTIPDSVTRIDYSAFASCTSLTSVTIPDSVTSMGRSVFYDTAIYNNEDNWEDGVLYIGKHLIQAKDSITGEYKIKDNTLTIAVAGFRNCKSLTSIIIPHGVMNIGEETFEDCTSLTSVAIPDSVTSIGDWAFGNCQSVQNITIPDSVTSIGWSAFNFCLSLTNITIPDSVTDIGDGAFSNCTSLTEINVSENNKHYTSEGGVLFSKDKTKLLKYPEGKKDKTYKIPNTVTHIGTYAFENYTFADCALTSVTIPDSVTNIGGGAFISCKSLANMTIPDSVTSIGWRAFRDCTALTNVTLGKNVANIGEGAFMNCISLSSITIPDGVTSIENETFRDCTSLSSVAIPDSVTSVGYSAFKNCASLTNITLPDSVTSIQWYAFEDCTSLISIDIPNGVTSIGNEMFCNCTSLTSIIIPDSVTKIGNYAFAGCSSLISVTIPNSVKSIEHHAFTGCTSLTSVTVPYNVTRIEDEAFGFYSDEKGNRCKVENFTIYGQSDSAADRYAEKYGFTFVPFAEINDSKTDISIIETKPNAIPESTELKVETTEMAEARMTYDITLTANDTPVQPAAPVTVKIPVPATMDGSKCKVYRQEADGTYTDMQAFYQDGYMVFTTDHFSIYVLTVKDPNAPAITMGDINGDGVINAVDARWALQSASGVRTLSDEQFAAADVNGDGKITAVDARWILQAASGVRVL